MRNHEGEAVPELDDLSAADSGTIRPSSREAALVVTDSSRLGPLHHSIRERVAALEENERAGRASTRHGSVTEADENQIKIEHPVSSLFQGSDSERRQRRWSVGAVRDGHDLGRPWKLTARRERIICLLPRSDGYPSDREQAGFGERDEPAACKNKEGAPCHGPRPQRRAEPGPASRAAAPSVPELGTRARVPVTSERGATRGV